MEGKSEIRKSMLERLRMMEEKKRPEKSRAIEKRLRETAEFKGAGSVFCYVSKRHEADTRHLIKRMLAEGKEVFVPKTDKKGHNLSVCRIMDFEKDLKKGAFGIMEPVTASVKDIRKIGMWIIPGIAFDERGYRVGHGKGYFDSFFREGKGSGIKTGLAYSFQIVPRIPEKRYDVPVDLVVTDEGVINCREHR